MSQVLALPEPQTLASWGDRKLDNAIQRGHAAAGAHMKGYEEAATVTGVLLRERKHRLPHGEWYPWLEENFAGTPQTATKYIRMADEAVPQIENPVSISTPESEVPEDGCDDAPEPTEAEAYTILRTAHDHGYEASVQQAASMGVRYPDELEEVDGEVVVEPAWAEAEAEREFIGDPEEDYADIRAQLVGWFAKGRVVVRLLHDGVDLRVLPQRDREDLLGDAELMADTAERVKKELLDGGT